MGKGQVGKVNVRGNLRQTATGVVGATDLIGGRVWAGTTVDPAKVSPGLVPKGLPDRRRGGTSIMGFSGDLYKENRSCRC